MTTTSITTAAPLTGIDGLLEAIYDALTGLVSIFRVAAPQCQAMPYVVITPLGGDVTYFFAPGTDIQRVNIAITQYSEWTGDTSTALALNESIVAALDRLPLTADGIMMRRITAPRVIILDGTVLQVSQDWSFELME